MEQFLKKILWKVFYTLKVLIVAGCLLLMYVIYEPHLDVGPLPSNRHHRSCADRLEGKGENYQVCSVQYCVQQLCTVRCTHI